MTHSHVPRRAVPVLLLLAAVCAPCCRAAPLTCGDGRISLEVDPANGALTRVVDAGSGVALAPPAGMAESFRLVLRQPDGATSTIIGKDQKLSSHRSDGSKLSLSWDGPLADGAGAPRDVDVRMDIESADGSLTFTLHVSNRATGKVAEVRYPLIGGLTGFAAAGRQTDAAVWMPTSTPWQKPVALPFGDAVLGYPGQLNMSFSCVQSASLGKSLYFASHDPIARAKHYRFTEMAGPGGSDVFASIQHLPLTPTGGTFDGSPVVLRFVDGDWRAAGRVYRDWFIRTFGIARPPQDWIRAQSFFLMTMFMLPEGTICYTFKDIPAWARSAKEHGINAVQISGWQRGGHDNGYPYYTPDPRLGTWEDLAAGIRECHKMGLKVYFFANYQPMMVDSNWYKRELSRYREMGPDGGLTWLAGWGMGTLWARAGHPKLMTWADLGFPEFRKVIVDQFARLASIGADGVHVDKMFPSALDYNPAITMSPDSSTWEGAIILTREVMRECRKRNPDWAMSFECNWDRMLEFGGATWWVGNQLITRQVFPENVETLGLYQAYDYLGVNNAVRDGHVVMVAPQNFTRSLDWAPFRGLADYIKEVKRIRDGLADAVFYGEVLGRSGVTLANPDESGLQYTVFRNRSTGGRVCVLTNSGREDRRVAFTGFEGSAGGRVRVQVPFQPARVMKLPAKVAVPGERIAFVEELGGAR